MAVPIIIVRPLQMSGALKFQVVSAFLFRIGYADPDLLRGSATD